MLTLEGINEPYTKVSELEYNTVILNVLREINRISEHPNQRQWDAHWDSYTKSQPPSYLVRDNIFRYQGKYIKADPYTELRFGTILKEKCFIKYFNDIDTVAEFGCGPGHNLKQISEIFPKIKRYGYDWSSAAIELASNFAITKTFDMLNPELIDIDISNLGVLTCGSMEQLGDNFQPFLEFLTNLKAKIYVHMEPIIELYNEDCLFDYLALMYHSKRKYLGKFYTSIKKEHNVVDLINTQFGNWLNDGYNILVWKTK